MWPYKMWWNFRLKISRTFGPVSSSWTKILPFISTWRGKNWICHNNHYFQSIQMSIFKLTRYFHLKCVLFSFTLNFFQTFCFTLASNQTFSLVLWRKTEVLLCFNWLFTKYCAAGNSNCRRIVDCVIGKNKKFGAIS